MKHYVLIVPGLGDQREPMIAATKFWERFGLTPVIHLMGWYEKQEGFKSKLSKFLDHIDAFAGEGGKISLVGCSAGASAVLNAYLHRKRKIHRVVNVCGRLRKGLHEGFRSFEERTSSSPSFRESVLLFEESEQLLSAHDREKILTIRARFGDELVPSDTAILEKARNITIPTIEHVFSIAMALTLFSRPLLSFLNESY